MSVNDARISRRGLLSLGAAGALGAGAVLLGRPSAASAAGGWQVLATHPQAAAQPTPTGRVIADLEIYAGALFAGYGDYGKNTGPIAINPFDLATGRFRGVVSKAYTHQIGVWRRTSFGLAAPNIDPLKDVPDNPDDPNAGVTWTTDGRTWTHTAIGRALHVFDYADTGGERIAVGSSGIGSEGAGPVIWRRIVPQGWNRSFTGDSAPSQQQDRYYWVAAVDGVPYVQARGLGRVAPMRRLDKQARAWRAVPAISDEFHPSGQPRHVQVCQGAIVSLTSSRLRVFRPSTGASRTVASPDGSALVDLYVNDGTLWVLTAKGVFRSDDVAQSFRRVADAPARANAVAAGAGKIFVGTTDSRLLGYTL